MFALGVIFLILALLLLIFNCKSSFDTQGGALGQVPIFGSSVIQIPMLTLVGINFLEQSGWLYMVWWGYVLAGIAVAVVVGVVIIGIGNYSKNKSPSVNGHNK